MEGTLTFLGTGTSMGVPSLGCSCSVCTSADPHDKRLRPSVLLRWPCAPPEPGPIKPGSLDPSPTERGLTEPGSTDPAPCERIVVIDTGPDFRTQALQAGIHHVDAVLYTHSHADHILGLDDLRPLSFATYKDAGPIPLYVTPETRAALERIFEYTFSPHSTYPHRARVVLRDATQGARIGTADDAVQILPIPVFHGELPITGYRFGNTAYLTDVSAIPESTFALLEGIETLIVSALRHTPHPSHATVEQAVRWAERIQARQTWFTHISHDLGHAQTNATLPAGMALAYDGLTLPVRLA